MADIFMEYSKDDIDQKFSTLATPENISNINMQLAEIAQQVKTDLQTAIDNTPINGVLRLNQGQVYTVSTPLTISKYINIEGNGATIQAVSSMAQVIMINQTGNSDALGGLIENLNVDCNNQTITYGVNVSSTGMFNLDNVHISNATNCGLRANGNHEGFYKNLRFTNCQIGIIADGSDQHFSDIGMRYCHTAIQNNAFNRYNRVHAWISDNFVGSVFASINNSPVIFTDCYPDTYNYAYQVNSYVAVQIIGGNANWGSTVENGVTPYFLYYADMKYSADTKVSHVYISPNSGKFYVTNSQTQYDFLGTISDTNLFFNFNNNFYSGKRYQATLQTGVTATLNKIVVKNNRVLLEMKVQLTTAPGTSTVQVGSLPTGLYPENDKIFGVHYGNAYTVDGTIYGYISSAGSIKVNSSSTNITDATKYYNINVEYDIGFDNHS